MPKRSILLLMLMIGSVAAVGNAATAQSGLRQGKAAFGSWRADKPGTVRLIRPQDMPKPGATRSVANASQIVPRPAGIVPQVPPGFNIELFAEGLSGPRIVRVAPNGDIFVAETRAGRIRVFRAKDGASKPDTSEVYAEGLKQPFGIAFFPVDDPRWLYVANTDSVVRFPYRAGDLKPSGPAETMVTGLPTGGHSSRDIVFTPDNKRMLVSVGSAGNDGEGLSRPPGGQAWSDQHAPGAAWGNETNRAAVLSFDPDGKDQKLFATGIRNCVGLAVQANGVPWCSANERDGLGDDLVPDYVTRIDETGGAK